MSPNTPGAGDLHIPDSFRLMADGDQARSRRVCHLIAMNLYGR